MRAATSAELLGGKFILGVGSGEAVELIRKLWTGEVYIFGFGPKAPDLAARIGDGYVNVAPEAEMVDRFKKQSGGTPACPVSSPRSCPPRSTSTGPPRSTPFRSCAEPRSAKVRHP